MARESTPHAGVEAVALGAGSTSGFAGLAPEIQDQMYRRLGGMGLVYAGGWAANFLFHRAVHLGKTLPVYQSVMDAVTVACIVAGLAVWYLCRRRVVPARVFPDFAVGFQILGGLGIFSTVFLWLDHGTRFVQRVAEAMGIDPAQAGELVVAPIDEVGLRLLYTDGVTWVGVWLLVFPLMVPMPMLRTVVATLATAATVPAVLIAAMWIRGVPEAIEPWAWPYVIDATVPTFICAGIAIFGSRVVYSLARDLSKARRMGNYQLVEKIGTGGMGEVWRAEHRMLARPAAIKLIRPETLGVDHGSSQVARRRFEREVHLTSQLHDPHTITIFDYGQTPDGTLYYVMELLEGINLDAFVRRFGPARPARVIAWLRQACASLEEAHALGLIHRDVKPANLYTCRYGLRTDFLKVLDFGLVKQRTPVTGDVTRMTVEHQAIGTPAYMPPELAMGSEADPRSDVYALGCVAYWLLTGQTVFEGSAMEQAVAHARDEPVRPSARFELDVPDDLESVIVECLAKDPDGRPESARDLARRLAACTDAGRWSDDDAAGWWDTHLPEVGTVRVG